MINMKILIILVVAVFLFFGFGCINGKQIEDINKYPEINNGKSIEFEEVCILDYMGGTMRDTKAYVLNNKSDFDVFTSTTKKSCDNVDFGKYTVIGASLKYSPEGGGGSRGIKVTKVVETDWKVFVILQTTEIPKGALASAATSHPLALYKIKKTDKEIIFVE